MSNNSDQTTIIPLSDSYPTALYVFGPILITYFGIYLMLRNHYVFKPRIQKFLKKTKIKSFLFKQIIIDLFSSLSVLTFLLSSIILVNSDQGIQLIIHNDLYWSGLFMGILAYRNIKEQEQLEMKVVTKNALFLIFEYVLIVYQYFSGYSFLMMGLLLMTMYIINMVFRLYQQKFINFIEELFNSKPKQIQNDNYKHTNLMECPQYLSANFPVSKGQLQQKMAEFDGKLKKLKLKTKLAVTRKLLMISLSVRISQEKMMNKMKRDTGAYYGGLNGTTNEKVKRMDYDFKKTYTIEEGNKDKQAIFSNNEQQEIDVNISQADDQLEVLFTIFPIKLFESSTIISMLFTLLLNLSFGLCLDYVISMTSTIKYGGYLNNLYALLLLPVLPNISKVQYFNSMCLSTLWKYFLIGFFVTIGLVINSTSNFRTSNILGQQAILLILLITIAVIYLLSGSKSQYKMLVFFFIGFCFNIGLVFYGIEH